MYIAGYQLAPSTPVGFPWGQVFQARARDGRAVVLHVLDGMPDVLGFNQQLLTELRPLLQLSHPSLVPLLDMGLCDDGAAFVVTDTYSNTDVLDWLNPIPRQARVSALHILHVIARACDGVSAVHRAGWIHGDLGSLRVRVGSGTNIEDMEVKVLLPGIEPAFDTVWKRMMGDEPRCYGNPNYFAPEKMHEQPLTAAADCYSLGVILFECLGNTALFSNVWEKLNPAPVRLPPCGLPPSAHAAVDALLQSLLATDPALRPQDATEVARTLRRIAAAAERGRT